jgi:dihydrofolate reductase
MRIVNAGLFHSVDGVVESPDQWQFDSFDDEIGAALSSVMTKTDTVLMGRVGYEQWADYWPTADDPFARFINPVRKYVASRTWSGDVGWENASLITGDLFDFVRELKQADGGDISVCASISLVRQLFFAGLLDELTLVTHPVVAGGGRRPLFDPDGPTTRLTLQEAVVTSKGNLIATYGLRPQ